MRSVVAMCWITRVFPGESLANNLLNFNDSYGGENNPRFSVQMMRYA